jgi:hypothetical protein
VRDEQGVGAVATNDVDAVLDTDHIESDSVQQLPKMIPIEPMVTSEGRITVERAVLDVEVELVGVATTRRTGTWCSASRSSARPAGSAR